MILLLTHGDRSCNAGYLKLYSQAFIGGKLVVNAMCFPCSTGQYSTTTGATECLACTNKPSTNAYYIAKADNTPFTSNACSW